MDRENPGIIDDCIEQKETRSNGRSVLIGRKYGFCSAVTGVMIAQLIITILGSFDQSLGSAFLWFLDFHYIANVLIGILALICSGTYLGGIAGNLIISQNKNSALVGISTGVLCLIICGIVGSLLAFFSEGLENSLGEAFSDYIVKPVFWICFFGLLPSILVGLIFGKLVKFKRS